MSWEQRGKRRYYYRTRRVNGKVVRQYLGAGEEAQAAAAEDERKQQRRLVVRGWLHDRLELRQLGRLRLKVLRMVHTVLKQHEEDIAAGLVPGEGLLPEGMRRALQAEIRWQPARQSPALLEVAAWKGPTTGNNALPVRLHRVNCFPPRANQERQRATHDVRPAIVDRPIRDVSRSILPRGPPGVSSMAILHTTRTMAPPPPVSLRAECQNAGNRPTSPLVETTGPPATSPKRLVLRLPFSRAIPLAWESPRRFSCCSWLVDIFWVALDREPHRECDVTTDGLPIIDIEPLTTGAGDTSQVAEQIHRACREHGFFYVVGHGVSDTLQQRLETLSRKFFALDHDAKMAIRMERGGRAWRGFFPVGSELTSGKPDQKEGIYFGAELSDDHPKVAAGVPMFGRNLFPEIAGFRETVLEYLDALTQLGHRLMTGISLSLDLSADYFRARYTDDPLILFRIFHYPALDTDATAADWSVGEHTDYGLLTILRQDRVGGLQVKSRSAWMDAPPIEGSFVCNIGDMLDRMTSGLYRSTPHRVKNTSATGRLSFPFFFDPNFDAIVQPVDPGRAIEDDRQERWDQASVHEFGGTYGDYVLGKVSKVFPELDQRNLKDV